MAKLISVQAAHDIIARNASPLSTDIIPLRSAHGHVLAQDIQAKVTLPPLGASAMDGYAVKLEPHYAQGAVFTRIGEAPAGAPFQGSVKQGECVRIFTGGAVPDGANHVIMQENVSVDGNKITLTKPISPASHIRKAGIDFKIGDMVLKQGHMLDAYGIAMLAATNHGEVKVFKRPKVALIANGDELTEPGTNASIGNVISSNPYALAPLIESWGARAVFTGISKDDPAAIKSHIESHADADILVPIGGASVGDHDYMRGVFDQLGLAPLFTKIAVKPGKPTWLGTLPSISRDKQYVLGLPGNPASALVCAHIFLKPLIMALCGNTASVHTTVTARLTEAMKPNTWRSEYVRACAKISKDGTLRVTPYPRQDSSLLTPFLSANCFLVRAPETPALHVGDTVQIYPIKPIT